MLDKKVKITTVQNLGARNYLLAFRSPEQARLAQPGQFVMIKCCGEIGGTPLLRRPFTIFSVSRTPSGRPAGLEILVKDVGAGTHKLAGMRAGQELHVLGPQGRPFQIPESSQNRIRSAVLVAGGVGIAAVHLLARKLRDLDVRPVLVYGGRTAGDLVLRESFERLSLETLYTTEDGSLGERGMVTEPLRRLLEERSRRGLRLYACGPWPMLGAVHELAARYRVPCEVSLEARMGCSLGACMGCVIRGWNSRGEAEYIRVCSEGPVLDSRTVDWSSPPF